MKSTTTSLAVMSGLLLLAGCTSLPAGPSVMALPGSGKSFEQFRADDAECRQYAQYQVGGTGANQAGVDAAVTSAAVGTVVGALAGAAVGGHQGAGVGAASGLVVGSMAGAGAGQSSAYASQRYYDNAYVQCMYAKGQQVPVPGSMTHSRPQTPVYRAAPAAPETYSYPPPPPGYAPPPGYPPPPGSPPR